MRVSLIVLFSMILPTLISAQVIESYISVDGEVNFEFDKNFIQSKSISEIRSTYSSKKPNKVITPDLSKNSLLRFNKNGNIEEHKNTFEIAGNKIKKHEISDYKNNRIQEKLELDHLGYFKTYYTYSEDTVFYNSYRSSEYSPENSIINDSILVNSGFQTRFKNTTYFYNKNGVNTKSTTTELDSIGLLKSELTRFVFSPNIIEKTYTYNEEGLVNQVKLKTIGSLKTFKYFYNRTSNLERVEYHNHDKLVTEYEIVYNSSGWVDAIIKHDLASQFITIERMTYSFF